MPQLVELACRAADQGAFDTAHSLAEVVSEDQGVYAACQSLIGSIFRQVGRHDLAEPHDQAGSAALPADPLGVAMCRLGLAADAVGSGSAAAAGRLDDAGDAVREVPVAHWATRWFDPWLTHAWVEAEVALQHHEPHHAVEVLEPFARVRPRSVPNTRWPHDRAKTWLFLGVAQRCDDNPSAARHSLTRAVTIAARAGLRPLLVPAVQQLQELDADAARPWSGHAAAATGFLRAHLPTGSASRG